MTRYGEERAFVAWFRTGTISSSKSTMPRSWLCSGRFIALVLEMLETNDLALKIALQNTKLFFFLNL